MIDEAVTVEDFDSMTSGDSGLEESPETARVQARRRLISLWRSIDGERRSNIMGVIIALAIVGSLYGLGFGTYQILKHNSRTQAIQRARKMDGEVYTIKGATWNWIGDTRLFLENERGEDAGWVMIHMNNPFTFEVNGLYLAFREAQTKRYVPNPFPMKVRAHFRQEAWTSKNVSSKKENFSGSFIEFERLDESGKPVKAAPSN